MKKLVIVHLLLFCVLCVASAQDIVLTSTSEQYPYIRGQWSQAKCNEWQQKYGPIRGVNCPYPPCAALTQEQALAKAAQLGYNSVRMWPGGGTNAEEYIKSVEQWAMWAARYGMTVSPVFSFCNEYFKNHANREAALKGLETEVRTIIRHFRDDERIVLWDLWNEPNLNDESTPEIMDWITKMVKWCQQEGCTQAISASIVWDGGVWLNNQESTGNRLLRDNVERLMDVHNYHDYNCQDSFNGETASMVNRLNKLGERPLVCTECMTRTNGSTYARTLVDFAKYNINFYTWGLYACDANWETKWERSTFFNWDPMFHNALYADGEPYNESEVQWVKNFAFQGDFGGVATTAEFTERWSARRAWKWMINGERKALFCDGLSAANAAVFAHESNSLYNTICVNIPYEKNANAFSVANVEQFNALLSEAEKKNLTVLPILFTSADASCGAASMSSYACDFVNRYYSDRRIQAWCLFRQTEPVDNVSALTARLKNIFRKVRYVCANQPLFAAPMTEDGVKADSTSSDVANLMWQLSDVCGISAASASNALLDELAVQYYRPVFLLSEQNTSQVPVVEHLLPAAPALRWPAWMAWRWMDREPVRGLSCANIAAALTKLNDLRGAQTPYNSICVAMDFRTYATTPDVFYTEMDSLLDMAGEMGITVLPQLLNDNFFRRPLEILKAYTASVLARYAHDRRILAWDLFNKMCAMVDDPAKGKQLVDELFLAARNSGAQQPIFMTPAVSTKSLPTDFDCVKSLVHGNYDGWSRLTFSNGDAELCYKIWCMSDVIGYASSQKANGLGWLNAQACKFGRPLFCAEWKHSASDASSVLDIFRDMHVSWFVNGTLDDTAVQSFRHLPVSTEH